MLDVLQDILTEIKSQDRANKLFGLIGPEFDFETGFPKLDLKQVRAREAIA